MALVPRSPLEGLQDQGLLHRFQIQPRRGKDQGFSRRRRTSCDLRWQQVRADGLFVGQEEDAFDEIAKLPGVTWPIVGFEGSEGLSVEVPRGRLISWQRPSRK